MQKIFLHQARNGHQEWFRKLLDQCSCRMDTWYVDMSIRSEPDLEPTWKIPLQLELKRSGNSTFQTRQLVMKTLPPAVDPTPAVNPTATPGVMGAQPGEAAPPPRRSTRDHHPPVRYEDENF